MKKRIGVLLLIMTVLFLTFLFGIVNIYAEGILPSLSETVGIGLPSLGEALKRYPDSEQNNIDGSMTELYINVSEEDFNIFSVYLKARGAELADYQVDGNKLTAEIHTKDASFSLIYDNHDGEAKVIYPAGTFDEWLKSAKTHFETAQQLLGEDKADEALNELLMIPYYKLYIPADNLLQNDKKIAMAREERLALYRTVGNIVTFGYYEQDNNKENGLEKIEWIVLEYNKKEKKALLISRYGLDCKPLNSGLKSVNWEGSTLRRWLNDDFIEIAFTDEEQAVILVTEVDNSSSQDYSEWKRNDNNTQDKIFLLSYAEANKFFGVTFDDEDNVKSRVAPTAYAIAKGAKTGYRLQTAEGEETGDWWLRSPGYLSNRGSSVGFDGSFSSWEVSDRERVVRPAFWLDLESDIF